MGRTPAPDASGPQTGRPRRRALHARAAMLAVSVVPAFAFAHGGVDGGAHHTLLQGLVHPFAGFDHLLAMLAVGSWGAWRGGRARWGAPLLFISLLLSGAVAAATVARGASLPGLDAMLAVSLLALGLLVALHRVVPAVLAVGTIAVFAFCHGLAHGLELGAGAALPGMVLGSLALHLVGLGVGAALRRHAPRAAWATGAALAGAGAALLLGSA